MTIRLDFGEQDPAGFLTYEIDVSAHASAEGSPIIALTWSVMPFAGDATPLNVSSQTNVNALGVPVAPGEAIAATRVRLQGGTLGHTYRVRALLTYANGGIEPVSFTLTSGET